MRQKKKQNKIDYIKHDDIPMITLRVCGEKRRSIKDDWQKVICFVAYDNASSHRKIVEDSFQYHLRLDLDEMKQNYPGHFLEPHNIGRAILLYYYFRERHCFFNDKHWEYVNFETVPNQEPDAEGKDYKLWVLEEVLVV